MADFKLIWKDTGGKSRDASIELCPNREQTYSTPFHYEDQALDWARSVIASGGSVLALYRARDLVVAGPDLLQLANRGFKTGSV